MLLALSGWVSGYGGGFAFDKPGDLYGEEKYVGMRVVSNKLHILLISNTVLLLSKFVNDINPQNLKP